MFLRFQKAAVRKNYETGNQAFSIRLRFLTKRGVQSFPEYWRINRRKLTAEQCAEYQAREDAVWSLVEAMECYVQMGLEGSGTTQKDLDDTVLEVKEMVEKYGTVSTAMFLVPNLWKPVEASLRERIISQGRTTELPCLYGFILAIPGDNYLRFMAKFGPKESSKAKSCGSIKCEVCGFDNIVPLEVVRLYQNSERKLPCELCRAVNTEMPPKRSPMSTEDIVEKIENWRTSGNKPGPEDEVFDRFGRVRF
jgi:hypothetical protein